MKKFICKNPWTHFEVNNPNGDVTMCCDNTAILGNVNVQSIMEIWNSPRYQKMRADMLAKGAHEVCSRFCPVLSGGKSYQSLDWYKNTDKNAPLYINAKQNEVEIKEGKSALLSKPRWMRFAYSYVCNLNCYHCYQGITRKEKKYLPDKFINELYSFSDTYQVIFYFGGEPFLYEPTKLLLKSKVLNPDCLHFFVTNATLLNNEIFKILESKNIGLMSCSLDAASEETYKSLRKSNNWAKVMDNLLRIKELKKVKNFAFDIGMTLNSRNAFEIEKFVDLGISLDAEPYILLVTNPFMSLRFQREYLHFSDSAILKIIGQIDTSIRKLRDKSFTDAVFVLEHTKNIIKMHQKGQNNLLKFLMYKNIYGIYNRLPMPAKMICKKIIRLNTKNGGLN